MEHGLLLFLVLMFLIPCAMIIFEIEALYNHIRSFYVKEEK
jgi:hypothetical protein